MSDADDLLAALVSATAPPCPACHGWRTMAVIVTVEGDDGRPALRHEQRPCVVCAPAHNPGARVVPTGGGR